MVSVKNLKLVIAIGLSLMVLPANPVQAERSPIFGSARIEALSIDSARDITARGILADWHGAITVNLAYTAYIYSYYARYFAVSNSVNEANWYMTAANNAYWAYVHAYWASLYSTWGM